MSCGFSVLEAEGGYSQTEQLRKCPRLAADSLGTLGNERAVWPNPHLLSVEPHAVMPLVKPFYCLLLRPAQRPHSRLHHPVRQGPPLCSSSPRPCYSLPGLSFHPTTFTFTPFPLPRISHSATFPD